MKEMKDLNIPSLSAGTAVGEIVSLWGTAINRGILPAKCKVFMLSGSPGVGKSTLVSQIGAQLEAMTGRPVSIRKIELQYCTPPDLKGLPVADSTCSSARWLIPAEFQLDPDPGRLNLVFFDELTDAMPSVLAAAKAIVLDRQIAEHRLPDNTLVICAGNRSNDLAAVSKLPGPLANRFVHFQIVPDFRSWETWAKKNGVNAAVMAFLKERPDKLSGEVTRSAFATPRTWTDVSDIMNLFPQKSPEQLQNLIGGTIGLGLAAEFAAWYTCCRELPSVESVLAGQVCTGRQLTASQSYFMVMALSSAAGQCKRPELRNLVNYAVMQLSREYQVLLFTTLIDNGMRTELSAVDSFRSWLTANGKYLR